MCAAKRNGIFATLWLFIRRCGGTLKGNGRRATATFAVLAAVAVGIYFFWGLASGYLRDDPRYILTLDGIEATEQPDWIQTDVKREVFEKHLRPAPDIRDEQFTPRVAQAFRMHEWVKDVRRVRKFFPARIEVEVVYRRPVAYVEFKKDNVLRGWPVDGDGVLLPASVLSEKEANRFPRIVASGASPVGTVGTPWGDPRIRDAARIADVLEKSWHTLGLYRVVAVDPEHQAYEMLNPTYELHTRQGARVLWGRAPGREVSNEPKAKQKLSRLVDYVRKNGPLEKTESTVLIDLQNAEGVSTTKRTADGSESG
jgi:hypothetical protein